MALHRRPNRHPFRTQPLVSRLEETRLTRRGFLHGTGVVGMAGLMGISPLSTARAQAAGIADKSRLTLLNDRPVNLETPAHLLDDAVTPVSRHFVRNNGIPPADPDPDTWTLRIDGLVDRPLELSIADLRRRFEMISRELVIECAGNGRAFFDPPASGNQWTYGAVGCSRWTGVRLRDVLQAAGVRDAAVYTAHEGADRHLADPGRLPISRGIPIAKALQPDTLIAFAMNDGPLHPMHGAPLRLVVPGWPGSCSHKWLTRIRLRDRVHDGEKMGPYSYRIPAYPTAPGEDVSAEDFRIIERMPVKSLITHPRDGTSISDRRLTVRGHAWAGERRVDQMTVSADFGATWQSAHLESPANPGAWQHWWAELRLPGPGYYEVWARAVDDQGIAQPFTIGWNPRGYLNNWYHRVAVTVT